MEKTIAQVVRVGTFEVDLEGGELRKGGLKLKFSGQPFQVLAILLEQPGAVVTREQLQKRLWPDTFVDVEHNLNSAINRIREALGDSAESPRFVETLPRRGYRFIAPVDGVAPITGNTVEQLRPRFIQRSWVIAASVLLILFVIAAGWQLRTHRLSPSRRITSVAVLPLTNLSGDAGQEYFADGITDELITHLSHVPALKVISRTSVIRYKGTKKSLPEIARELGVEVIVEGTVARSGNRVRVSAQLIDARSDTHLWADAFERDLQDILALQAELALAISRHVSFAVSSAQEKDFELSQSVNPIAYELYLKGRQFFWTGAFKAAQDSFAEAIRADPHYARAYAGLADAYNLMGNFDKGKEAAQQALQIQPHLADAHASLGWAKLASDLDWKGAEQELKLALQDNPNNENAHLWYGCELVWEGRFTEGLAEMRTAAVLAPTTSSINAFYGMGLYQARRYDEAIKQLKEAVQLDISGSNGSWMGL